MKGTVYFSSKYDSYRSYLVESILFNKHENSLKLHLSGERCDPWVFGCFADLLTAPGCYGQTSQGAGIGYVYVGPVCSLTR